MTIPQLRLIKNSNDSLSAIPMTKNVVKPQLRSKEKLLLVESDRFIGELLTEHW